MFTRRETFGIWHMSRSCAWPLAVRFTSDFDAEQLKEEYEDDHLFGENAIMLVESERLDYNINSLVEYGESRAIDPVWADILAMKSLKTPLALGVVRFPLMAIVMAPLQGRC